MNLSSSRTDGSFRDPRGRLWKDGGRVLREVFPEFACPVLSWLESPLANRWIEQGRMVPTQVISSEPGQSAVMEHPRIFFPSYPWEWAPGQWIEAASLTLDLCEEAVESGLILKDATPLNILFSGPRPILVDVLSCESRDLRSPLWLAYAQFVRTFLLPLCAYVYLGWPLSATQQYRDGYEPAYLAPFLSCTRRWRWPLRSLVTIPLLLEKRRRPSPHLPQASEEISSFALTRLLRSTRRLLHSLSPPERSSRWNHYMDTASHYKAGDHEAKQAFVRECLNQFHPDHVLDVGANTGVYSRIAAEGGADVVAWDTDAQATDLNWKTARGAGLSILPLVADFARPTPAVGWRNGESASLLSRAAGQFECVLLLGILHHLLLTDQIPLQAIFDQLSEITTRWAILEWIPQGDPQFEALCRGRDELYSHLSEEYFVQTLCRRFAVRNRTQLRNGRTLWAIEMIV